MQIGTDFGSVGVVAVVSGVTDGPQSPVTGVSADLHPVGRGEGAGVRQHDEERDGDLSDQLDHPRIREGLFHGGHLM